MISMLSLHSHAEYVTVLSTFNSSPKIDGSWRIFKDVHAMITNDKCPICECSLDGSVIRSSNAGNTTLIGTIDHYRPKDATLYPHLKYDHENYILMCSDCNNAYKGNQFPLHSSTPTRNITTIKTSQILDEKPLIFNPIYEIPFDSFRVVLKYTTSGRKVLELSPNSTDPYIEEKCKETIKIFSLGNCEDLDHKHPNINVQNCRIDLLSLHYTKFQPITSIMKGRKLVDLTIDEQKKVFSESKRLKLDQHGFFEFIMKGNYIDLVS